MLKKQNRLAKSKDVKITVSSGRSFFNPFCTVKVVPRSTGLPRFTVVVSTKVSKKAVVRNRIKRVLRESIRQRLANFTIGDYAVLVKPRAAAAPESELKSQFDSIMELVLRKV